MLSYGLKLGLAAAGMLLLGIGAIILFGDLWMQIGFGAALAVLAGVLLLVAWRVDRKGKQDREGLERV